MRDATDHTDDTDDTYETVLGPALLFCPADRPDRYRKAAAAADTVILDLEDAVAVPAKDSARDSLVASDLDPARTIVRLNPANSAEFGKDLAALARTSYRMVMLAKAETLDDLDALAGQGGVAAPRVIGGLRVIALCESPLGVRNAALLAEHPAVIALMWGAEDLVAGLGGSSSRGADGRYRDVARYARSQVLIAAAAAGRQAFDAVHLDIADLAGLRDEAQDAAASGFDGTVCIHPTQVEVVRSAYRPSQESLASAIQILEAAKAAPNGVFAFHGRMIDEPILRQARRLVAMAPD